jgi:hypothetical protein
MIRHLFLFIFSVLSMAAMAQKPLNGIVTDATTHQPLPGASVFLSNTSVGTTANSRGEFSLVFPAGKYDLVVSALDHETYTKTLTQQSLPENLVVELKPRSKEMTGVVIQSFEKDGWKTWGKFFVENFIGTSSQAGRCVFKNYKTLRFRLDRGRNILTVLAREPLLIENKALGYRIKYQLEEFSYDFNSRVISYTGYPLFEDLDAGAGRKKRWEKSRREVYEGSVMHFMRALFRNQLRQQGFSVYALNKIPNLKHVRRSSQEGDATIIDLENGTRIRCDLPADTIRFYQTYVGKEYELNITGDEPLPGDSIAYTEDSKTLILSFSNYLTVIYDKGKTPDEYQRYVSNGNFLMQSEITLIHGVPVTVEANGVFYNPLDLLTNGWWAWSEKIGTMLPFDYQTQN